MMCKVFKVTKSSYYRWLRQGPSDRSKRDEQLLIEIMEIFEQSKQSYGALRMTAELKARGWIVGKNKVAGMMQAADLRPKRRKKFKITTDSKHNYPVAPNLLDQEFTASRPGQVWGLDLTYVRTHKGWLYLTVIIDLYDRKVIGWSMSKGLSTAETIMPAWIMAVWNRPITGEQTKQHLPVWWMVWLRGVICFLKGVAWFQIPCLYKRQVSKCLHVSDFDIFFN